MSNKNVIRQDIVQIGFDSNTKELVEIINCLNDIKKLLAGGLGDGLDDVKESAEEAGDELEETEKKGKKTLATLKKIGSVSFKALLGGLAAAGVAVGGVMKSAVESYADYEQLVGGVETLLGAKGAKTVEEYAKNVGKSVKSVKKEFESLQKSEQLVLKNADNAYKTAGLSANAYMETVTGFSASLLQSVGGDTVKAANMADTAMTDMSDNANKMGTNMESIQNAYSGFAKGNFTMLDNLKLGYGGTKEEMARLIKDAAKMDKSVKANDTSFGNIVNAIHAVQKNLDISGISYQEYTKLVESGAMTQEEAYKLLGTTAKEANFTISGSLSQLKGAWSNTMTALIRGDNLDECIDNLIESAEIFGDNIFPAIEKGLGGLGKAMEKLAPKISEKLPPLIQSFLPPLVKAAGILLASVVKELPAIVKSLIPAIKEAGALIVKSLYEAFTGKKMDDKAFSGLTDSLGKVLDTAKKCTPVVLGLVGAFKLLKSLKGTGSIFGSLFGKMKGVSGKDQKETSGMFGWLKEIGGMNTKTVLKGVGNLAIVLGALGALLYIATKVFSDGINFKEMLQVIALVGVLGLVGGYIGKLAGTVGKIPIMTVLKGVANMGVVLVAMGALLWLTTAVFSNGINFGEMFQVIALMGILGVVGGVLSVIAAAVGLIPFPVVLAGIGNIALTIGALEAILLALGALSKIPGFNDLIKSGGELLALTFRMIGKAIGSLVGGLAEGVTGSLPVIGKHFAGFAKSMAGTDFTPIKNFFDALSSISSIPSSGGIFQLFTGDPYAGLLKMIPILPLLGASARAFMAVVGGITDFSPIKSLMTALSSVKGMPSAGGFFQLFTGDPYAGLQKMLPLLPQLALSAKMFMAIVGGVKDFSPISSLLTALSSVKGMPSSGGFFQLFTGDPYAGLTKMIVLLPSLGASAGLFFASIGDRTDFTAITSLMNALSSVKALPKSGGFAQFFTGDVYSGLAKLIVELPLIGLSVGAFYSAIGERTDFGVIPKLFNALSSVKNLPKAGGFAQFFAGSAYTALAAMILELPALGLSVRDFYTSLDGIDDFSKMTDLFTTLGGLDKHIDKKGGLLGAIDTLFNGSKESAIVILGASLKKFGNDTKGFFESVNTLNLSNLNGMWKSFANVKGLDKNITTIIDKIAELPKKMSDALKSGSKSLSTALVDVWKEAVKASVAPVNKLLSGANHILKEFGSKKRVLEWEPYAKGTNGHKGGNALVNDGRGAELIQMPNGRMFIPRGRNVFIPNAPKGMKVLPADRTAQLMGRKTPSFNYANGVGDIDIWNYYDNAKGLVDKIVEGISYNGLSRIASNIGQSLVSTFSGAMPAWIEKLFQENGQSMSSWIASKGVMQWLPTVVRALKMEGQYSLANVARTLYQMKTESGGNPYAINLWDSNAKNGTPSKGLMQVIDPTFRAYARDGYDKNIYDPLSNVLASIRYATSRYGSLSKAYRGVGYANGVGAVTLPESGSTFNYTPDSDSKYYTTSNVEHNTYAPNFTLTISGSNDDRILARKVKNWISEAMDDTFASFERKNPKLREV